MFNEVKTAQAAAYLLHKAGGKMKHLKLMKLLYLADRLSWKEYNRSITGDDYYSLPLGPVLSNTLNLIHGETVTQMKKNSEESWDDWIKDDANYCVSLAKEVDEQDEYFWDYLSIADEKILTKTFEDFGRFDAFALVEYTHNKKYIPEWQDPKGSRKRIELKTLLKCIGKTPEEIEYVFDILALEKAFSDALKG